MRTLVQFLAPKGEANREEWKFDQIIEIIQEHGLFDDVEIWQGRQQRDMFEKDGTLTSAGKSFFGKMLVRYDQRLFRVETGARLRFCVEGKGRTRKYIVVAAS